jgi:hypothetical protein
MSQTEGNETDNKYLKKRQREMSKSEQEEQEIMSRDLNAYLVVIPKRKGKKIMYNKRCSLTLYESCFIQTLKFVLKRWWARRDVSGWVEVRVPNFSNYGTTPYQFRN